MSERRHDHGPYNCRPDCPYWTNTPAAHPDSRVAGAERLADSAEALLRALIDHPHKCLCDDYNAIEKQARAALAAIQEQTE